MSDYVLAFPKLGEDNYKPWSRLMKAELMKKTVWMVVSGQITGPTASLDTVQYLTLAQKAAGIIFGGLEPGQQVLVEDHMESPKLMWEILREHHLQQKPTNRFLAYEALFSITKEEDESLTALSACISAALSSIMDSTPDKFTLDMPLET